MKIGMRNNSTYTNIAKHILCFLSSLILNPGYNLVIFADDSTH